MPPPVIFTVNDEPQVLNAVERNLRRQYRRDYHIIKVGGLGLNISYNIVVQKHPGDIKLSTEPGKTRSQVWLPLVLESS
jgi:signal transduction histidine kinase